MSFTASASDILAVGQAAERVKVFCKCSIEDMSASKSIFTSAGPSGTTLKAEVSTRLGAGEIGCDERWLRRQSGGGGAAVVI